MPEIYDQAFGPILMLIGFTLLIAFTHIVILLEFHGISSMIKKKNPYTGDKIFKRYKLKHFIFIIRIYLLIYFLDLCLLLINELKLIDERFYDIVELSIFGLMLVISCWYGLIMGYNLFSSSFHKKESRNRILKAMILLRY